MTPVAIGDIQRTQGTLKTVYKAKKPLQTLILCLHVNLCRNAMDAHEKSVIIFGGEIPDATVLLTSSPWM